MIGPKVRIKTPIEVVIATSQELPKFVVGLRLKEAWLRFGYCVLLGRIPAVYACGRLLNFYWGVQDAKEAIGQADRKASPKEEQRIYYNSETRKDLAGMN